MPYVKLPRLGELRSGDASVVAGDLNALLTILIVQFLMRKKLSYQTCNDIVGSFLEAEDEIREKVCRPRRLIIGTPEKWLYDINQLVEETLRFVGFVPAEKAEFNKPDELKQYILMRVYRHLEKNGISDQTVLDVRGAIHNALHEFKRRVQDPYENLKISENGDIYPIEFAPSILDLKEIEMLLKKIARKKPARKRKQTPAKTL